MENHDNSISESVTKDNSGEKPGNEITTQKAVKKDGNSNVKGRSEKSEKNSASTKEKHEKNANISGKHKKEYGKNDSIKKNSDGIKTYNVDENNQNNKSSNKLCQEIQCVRNYRDNSFCNYFYITCDSVH